MLRKIVGCNGGCVGCNSTNCTEIGEGEKQYNKEGIEINLEDFIDLEDETEDM